MRALSSVEPRKYCPSNCYEKVIWHTIFPCCLYLDKQYYIMIIQCTLIIVNAWIVNNLSLVNMFGETGRFFYNINYMLNNEHLSLVNKIRDKTEFTITRVHCTSKFKLAKYDFFKHFVYIPRLIENCFCKWCRHVLT